LCYETDPSQELDHVFLVEYDRSEESLHSKAHSSQVTTATETIPLFGFPELSLHLAAVFQALLVFGGWRKPNQMCFNCPTTTESIKVIHHRSWMMCQTLPGRSCITAGTNPALACIDQASPLLLSLKGDE